MLHKLSIIIVILALGLNGFAQTQDEYLNSQAEPDEKIYPGGASYEVKKYPQKFKSKKPKNIIFLIGDGMGVSHVFAGLVANHGNLFLENFKHIGFAKTQSADNFITDSAAGGTALSTGEKTYGGAIGVDVNRNPLKTILEKAEEEGIATGLVSTSTITHATPASFIAHQPNRNMYEAIAADFLKTDIDVFIGGGREHFTQRKDERNLVEELKQKGYQYEEKMENIAQVTNGKLVGLIEDSDAGRVEHRKDMLPVSTQTALNILSKNKKGFFLMVEGSQIDWGGHAGSTIYIVEDMLDFDKVIGKALDFASKDGKTLVVVTADHETGGMGITGGDFNTGMVKGDYTSGDHTGVMVPVFAYGPGAEEFTGIMDNTDVNKKMEKLLLGK
ncbi:MAG: alkaline phosphatase [Prolixibacteraceae bacterium]|nr:alkaline phosphatase [Prolixibacteraceae bacterium]